MRRATLPAWRVAVAEHDLPSRWWIEAQTLEVCAADERDARAAAAKAAHVAAGVPSMRSVLRCTYRHTSASPFARAA